MVKIIENASWDTRARIYSSRVYVAMTSQSNMKGTEHAYPGSSGTKIPPSHTSGWFIIWKQMCPLQLKSHPIPVLGQFRLRHGSCFFLLSHIAYAFIKSQWGRGSGDRTRTSLWQELSSPTSLSLVPSSLVSDADPCPAPGHQMPSDCVD